MKKNNGKLFYKLYFGSVVKSAAKFFSGLKAPLCTILSQPLSDNILVEIVKQNRRGDEKTSTQLSAPITERGMLYSNLEVMLSANY